MSHVMWGLLCGARSGPGEVTQQRKLSPGYGAEETQGRALGTETVALVTELRSALKGHCPDPSYFCYVEHRLPGRQTHGRTERGRPKEREDRQGLKVRDSLPVTQIYRHRN